MVVGSAPDGYGDFHPVVLVAVLPFLGEAVVVGAYLVGLPVHSGGI